MPLVTPGSKPQSPAQPCIVVHGGAWAIPEALTERSLDGVRRAAKRGYEVLSTGGSAVDAVEAAVMVLEDDPAFDAGRSSCLNARREVEMDAVIVTEGPAGNPALSAGAVAAVSSVRNPVCLARKVMEDTSHCLLVGANADAFAADASRKDDKIQLVESIDELVTPEAIAEWEAYHKYKTVVTSLFNDVSTNGDTRHQQSTSGHDTVGAVALDAQGRYAAATSTGGITHKMPGRVGDSPIIGSGAYVSAEAGGISTTGHGESIMKVALAKHALMLIEEHGMTGADAGQAALDHMLRKTGGRGGLIIIDATGRVAHRFTTQRMAWASIEGDNGKLVASGINE